MGKPFSMQAPEDVAKEYGGNKQSIAKAAQMGILDPTTAVMAGMFIDRMREAQAQEQQQTTTIAEQVFSPKPAPQGMPAQPQMTAQMPRGMGATPQAAQMQAMQQKMAPRPSVAGMNQLPMGPGMIPRAASGGLLAFAGGGDVPGYAPGGAPSRYGDLTEEDIIRLENNARLYEEANPSNLSDALVPIINPDDAALIDGSSLLGRGAELRQKIFDLEQQMENPDLFMERENLKAQLARTKQEQKELRANPEYQKFREEKFDEANMRARESFGQGQIGRSLGLIPGEKPLDERTDFDEYYDKGGYSQGFTNDAFLNFPVKEASEEEETTVAPEVTSEVTSEVASEVAPETKTKQDDQTKREIEAMFDGIVVPQDTTESEFKKLQDALGKRDTKYEDYLQTEEYLADKAKKEDLYTAMAEFGFRMAGSDSPYALQAAGQAGAATAPSVKEALKDARARKKDAKEKLALNEVAKRQEDLNLLKAASDRSTGGRKMQLDAQIAKAQKELGLYVANLNAATQRAILTADKKDEQNVQNRLANLKVLRGEPGSKYAGMSDAQLEDIARTEARTRVDSALTQTLARQKFDLDLETAVGQRVSFLRSHGSDEFKQKDLEEQERIVRAELRLLLQQNPTTKTTARDPDADAARINQS